MRRPGGGPRSPDSRVTVECEHGETDPSVCPPCQTTPALTLRDPDWSVPFRARYPGVCEGCDSPVDVGDPLRAGVGHDGPVEYRHDDPACLETAAV